MSRTAAFAALFVALGGCSSAPVAPGGKPPDCRIEFLEKAPSRPYAAIGELESHVTNPPPAGALEVLRPRACQLGADAVIVTRNLVLNQLGHVFVAGIAIKYLEAGPPQDQVDL